MSLVTDQGDSLAEAARSLGLHPNLIRNWKQKFMSDNIDQTVLSEDEKAELERLNNDVDVRHKRRALSEKEIEQLIQSALGSGCRVESYSEEERAKVYLLSYMTGLRRKELGSLCKRSFNLSAEPPTVTVEAKDSKHKKERCATTPPRHRRRIPAVAERTPAE